MSRWNRQDCTGARPATAGGTTRPTKPVGFSSEVSSRALNHWGRPGQWSNERKEGGRIGFIVVGRIHSGMKERSHLNYAKGRKSWAEPEVTFLDPSRRFHSLSRPSSYPAEKRKRASAQRLFIGSLRFSLALVARFAHPRSLS